MRRFCIPTVVFLMSIAAAMVTAQDPPAPQDAPSSPRAPQPTFRTAVNVVRVDVIVTDSSGNPVTNLTQNEFEIVENGQLQTIDFFRQIRIDDTATDEARPRQVLTRDTEEREASRDDVRIFAILLADYQVCAERSRHVRDALASFIGKLGPRDLVAVMNPLTSVKDLVFTYDHVSILNALQRFEGRRGNYTPRNAAEQEHLQMRSVEPIRAAVVHDALKALAIRLGSMREGRKSVIFVSEGLPFADPRRLREITQEANRHNTSIYPLDPRGLVAGDNDVAPTLRPGCARQQPMRVRVTQDALRDLADETDGRAIVERNALAEGLAQMLRDSSVHYLLGYSSTASQTDGKFHQIRVRVKRPNVDVRARKGYWASTAEDISRAANPVPVTPRPILDALAAIAAPAQDGRAVRTWVGISRGAEGKGRVTVVWEPQASAGGAAGRGETAANITIGAKRPQGETVFESSLVDLGPATQAQRVFFDVAAGALELRMTVADREGATIDRETRSIDVPDYAGAALGTPHFYRARTVREFQSLVSDADAIPVVTREFPRSERLLVRFDVSGGETLSPSAGILNRAGRKMFDVAVTRATAGASHQIDLALSPLPVGEYLLEVVAAPGGPRQLAAFRIR